MTERNAVGTKFTGRTTQQRHLILEIIERTARHLDADEIYRRARERLPNISLSTVYRTVQLLKEQGLVEEHRLNGERRYYERVPPSRHHHMVCLGCGRIFEFTCPSTEKIKSKLTKEKGFKVTAVDVRLVGYCPECQRSLKPAPNVNGKEILPAKRR